MPISRRALLSVIPASTLLALADPLRARAAGPAGSPAATAAAAGDRARVLANTVDVFAGTAASNARPEVAGKVAAIASAARSHLRLMDTASGSGELFRGVTLGTSDSNLSTSFQYLYEIALATRAPGTGSDLYGSDAVQDRVLDAMVRLYDSYYGDQAQGYYGNWYTWEIGISTYASRTLVLLGDRTAATRPDLPATYVAAMDGYLRNGKDGDVDLDSRFHTGANLADITANRILQGAVLGDDARICKAVADQLTVYATVDPYHLRHGVTDGFYADDSFIQHASVAYTGSYGTGLLTRVLQTIKTLDGTSYTQGEDLTGVVQGWVAGAFAPLIFEGWLMEIVKGRAVSRTATGYAGTAAVLEAVVDLAAYSSGEQATALGGYAKYLAEHAGAGPAGFVSPVGVARWADLAADPSVPARDLVPAAQHAAYPAMDRSVHRRPGYAFALARSSARISGYEYMSGENLMPWFQGSGAHYLYLAGQDQTQAFGVDYFTAVSPYALAGVTAPVEVRKTVPELYGTAWYDNPAAGFTSSSVPQNTYVYFPLATNAFSGGARLDAYGAAGWVQADDVAWRDKQAGLLPDDFVAYRTADATKSWFMFDDEIVVLAAGVGDSAGRGVTTTLDTRIADPSDPVGLTGRLRDGTPWPGLGGAGGVSDPDPAAGTDLAPPSWLRFADTGQGVAVGYAFLDGFGPGGARPDVALATVTRSRRLIRTSNPDTLVTKRVFAVSVAQPAGAPHLSMAYALLPGATESALDAFAARPVAVLANSTCLQAVRHPALGLLGANAFTPGTHHAGPVELDGPASVLLRELPDGTARLAIADPTTGRDGVGVVVHGRGLRALAADDGIEVTRVPGGTRITAATRHLYGRSLTVTLG